MATIYQEEIYLAEFRDITEEGVTRRFNSLEEENEKVKRAIDETNNRNNLHITTSAEDSARLLTSMSVFSKLDSTSFTVDSLTVQDSRRKLKEKIPYTNGNTPYTYQSFDFSGERVYLNQKIQYSTIYSSPQVKFKNLKSRNFNIYDIIIGNYEIPITNIQANSLLLNSPTNIINRSTDSSDRVNPMNRFTPSDTFQQAFGNSRIILENQNKSENYIFSTSSDLLKIGLTKRQILFKESNKQTTNTLNNGFTFKQEKIKIMQLDHHTYQSSKIRQGNTLHIYVNTKNSKTGVLAAVMLLNTCLPFKTEIHGNGYPFEYYINNVLFNQTQRYDNCVIYSVDPVLTSSQLVTFNETDIDSESIDDLYSFLSTSTGNAEDQQFANNIITSFMTLQELHKTGVHITIPIQSYPQPIGMFVSTNSSNIQNILQTENFNILYDYHLYKSLMLSKDIYITTKLKKFLTTDTYGIIREQSSIQINQYLREFYKNPFTISNTFTLSLFPNMIDKFIKTTTLTAIDKESYFTKLSIISDNYYNCLTYKGGDYDLVTWSLSSKINGLAMTQIDSVLLSCEEIESRKLVTHYDIDHFMKLIHNDYSDGSWNGEFEFRLFTNSNSSYIEDTHFEVISANHGLFVKIKINEITTSNCENTSYVIKFSDTPNVNTLNKMQNKTGVDLATVEEVKTDLYNVIKLSKNNIINSPNLSTWINATAYNIVGKQIKYKYVNTENNEIQLTFTGNEDQEYIEMLNNMFATKYVIKPKMNSLNTDKEVFTEEHESTIIKTDNQTADTSEIDEIDIGSGDYSINDDDESPNVDDEDENNNTDCKENNDHEKNANKSKDNKNNDKKHKNKENNKNSKGKDDKSKNKNNKNNSNNKDEKENIMKFADIDSVYYDPWLTQNELIQIEEFYDIKKPYKIETVDDFIETIYIWKEIENDLNKELEIEMIMLGDEFLPGRLQEEDEDTDA